MVKLESQVIKSVDQFRYLRSVMREDEETTEIVGREVRDGGMDKWEKMTGLLCDKKI